MTCKVLQVTDTHLFADPAGEQKGVNTCRTLRAVVNDIALHHPDFDALLLTGDLSQDETEQSYELLRQLLAPIHRAPFHAIPGNHDDPDKMRARLDDGDRFRVGTDVILDCWRIVMLNSRVSGAVHGEIGREQLARLRDTLAGEDRHVLVALHHPPVDIGCAWLDGSRCRDGEALLEAVASPSVKAVVSGHVHQEVEITRGDVRILTTPSTCVQFKPGMDEFAIDDAEPGYRVFELEANGRWSSMVRRVVPESLART